MRAIVPFPAQRQNQQNVETFYPSKNVWMTAVMVTNVETKVCGEETTLRLKFVTHLAKEKAFLPFKAFQLEATLASLWVKFSQVNTSMSS